MTDTTFPICSSAEDCLAQARKARAARQWDQALAFVRQGLESSPTNVGLRLEMVASLRQTERHAEARSLIDALLIEHPAHFGIAIEAGHLARQQRRFEDALQHFQRAQQIQPQNQWAPVGVAIVLRELNRYEESKAALQKILDVTPEYFDGLIQMGHLAARQRAHGDAVRYFRRALTVRPLHDALPVLIAGHLRELGQLLEAKTYLSEFLVTHGNHFGALLESGRIARQQARYADAIDLFQLARKIQPENDSLPCSIAACLRELRRFDEARLLLKKLLEAQPNHFNALLELGRVARQQSRYTEAIEQFQKALAINPSNSWLPCGIAACLRNLGRLDESQTILDTLLASQPDHFDALVESGHIANRQRRPNEALSFFRRANTLRPNASWVSLNLASVLRELGQFEEARQILAAILQVQPDHVEALLGAGYLARRERKIEKALELFKRAEALRPEHIGARTAVAHELRELGQIEEAIVSIGELAEPYDPSVAPLLHQRGEIATFQGNAEQAQHYFEASITADPLFTAGYTSLISEYQRLGLFEDAHDVIDRACKTFTDTGYFQVRRLRLAYLCGEFERVEDKAMPLLADNPNDGELWMTLVRAYIRTGEYIKARDAINNIPKQDLQGRRWIAECKAQLAWSQYHIETAESHAREWLRLSPDPAPALHFLATIHVCNGDTMKVGKILAMLKQIRQSHGSINIRKSAGKGLLDRMLREFRVNPFADRTLSAVIQLPLVERPAALGRAIQEEPGYIASAMSMLVTLRRLGLTGAPPINHGTVPSRIPRHVIQFWDSDPPADIIELMNTWKTRCHGFTYEVFDELTAELFLENEGRADVLQAFKAAKHPAMKADLFRLAYLYARGGIYADADDKCRHSIEPWLTNGLDLLLMQEDLGSIGNNFIAAAPEHPLILAALNTVTQNILKKQGGGAWWSSGPAIMTTAFCSMYLDALSQSRLPDGLHVIDYYRTAKRISMHVPRAYKHSDKYWLSPKSQARREFESNKTIRIDRTKIGWTINVVSESQ